MQKIKFKDEYLARNELLAAIYKEAKTLPEEYREEYINTAKKNWQNFLEETKNDRMKRGRFSLWSTKISIISGLIFILIILILAIFIPNPTSYQIFVFRIILALAAAAFGATIPGFLKLDLPIWKDGLLRAGGAIVIFVIIYMMNPPAMFS